MDMPVCLNNRYLKQSKTYYRCMARVYACLSNAGLCPTPVQLLYLDNEDRRERECMMQYQMSGPGDQDLNDPDRDVDDGFDMHAIVGMQQRQEDMDEDYDEIQRMLAVYVVMKDSVFMLVLCAWVRAWVLSLIHI